jgi:hypothetical protein
VISRPLFRDADGPIAPRFVDRGFVRARSVHADQDVLGSLRSGSVRSFKADAFPDAAFHVTLRQSERRPDGRMVLRGWIDDHREALAVAIVDDSGMTAVFRTIGGEVYYVHPNADSTHTVSEHDTRLFPACGVEDVHDVLQRNPPFGTVAGGSTCVDNGEIIDVLVLYTQSVSAGYGAILANRIQLMFAEANATYAASGIHTRLRLVHTAQVYYDETGTESVLLEQLKNPSDGILDVAHVLRDQYGADLVSMMVLNWGPCGVARILTELSTSSADEGFNVVQSGCGFFNLSFAHEVGHNMSNMHERESTTSIGLWDYGRGYRLASGSYRTIMATMSGTAPRIGHFSNPEVLYNGEPTGVEITEPTAAHAVRASNQVTLTIANYRPTRDCDDEGIPDECEPDCNGNSAADSCDILAGTSNDCDDFGHGNHIPDECEEDCNVNTIADTCDIALGTSEDGNGDGIPDECTTRRYVSWYASGANNGFSWGNAYPRLEDALAEAAAMGGPTSPYEIWVRAGTYRPAGAGGNRGASFVLRRYTEVYGGFAGVESVRAQRDPALQATVLSGDLNNNDGVVFTDRTDNSYHVVTTTNIDATGVLDGFTITGGYANGSFPNNSGGGMLIDGGGPRIQGCILADNWALSSGGGVYNTNFGAPLFDRCILLGNYANAEGGAMGNNFGGNVTVHNSLLIGNTSPTGAAIRNGGVNPTFVTFVNCTLYANASSQPLGSAIRTFPNAATTLVNSIVWANRRDAGTFDQLAAIGTEGVLSASYNCVQGWTGSFGGVGNFNADPQFVDDDPGNWALADLHLTESSPAVNAGNTAAAASPADLDERPRVYGGQVDLGAYELQPPPPPPPIPAASSWGLVILGVFILAVGSARIVMRGGNMIR